MGQEEIELEKKISLHIKSEMAKRGIDVPQLAELFLSKGYRTTKDSIRGKVDRGKFSFSFYIQFMDVLGVELLSVKNNNSLSPKKIELSLYRS